MEVYLIWKRVNDKHIAEVNEVVGYVQGDYEAADKVVDEANRLDTDNTLGGLYPYWKQEIPRLTPANLREFLPH